MRIKVEYEIDVEDSPYDSNAFPRTRVYRANDASGASYLVPMDAIITEIPPPFIPGWWMTGSNGVYKIDREGQMNHIFGSDWRKRRTDLKRVNITPVEE